MSVLTEYLPGSAERTALESVLTRMSGTTEEVPIMIGDQAYTTDNVQFQPMPHDHAKK